MHDIRKPHLQAFADWAKKHITGDEKGEAQILLDRLFIAFGRSGSLDVGGTPEWRIRRAKEDGPARLDAAVLAARGFGPKKDLLARLPESRSRRGGKSGPGVTAAGVPPSDGDAKRLVSEDCIRS